jgi:methyl-accepting chemotaxis protein
MKFVGLGLARENDLSRETLTAFSQSQAIIEFDPRGIILDANANFCGVMGYNVDEIRGRHHRMFVDDVYAASSDYGAFWAQLAAGQFVSGEFQRVGKGGKLVHIVASYNPVLNRAGRVAKIVKIAADNTAAKAATEDWQGQLAAISKSQAVIEFDLGGVVLTANENFCSALGYQLEEIRGRHHSIFVESAYAGSEEYRDFWRRLGAGQFESGEYLRLGRGGNKVWIQATYNPIFDAFGQPYKIVKYATDVTARKQAVEEIGGHIRRLADGDLAGRMPNRLPGELDQIRVTFNETVDRFCDVLRRLRTSSTGLKTATKEILSGANDLSDRTVKQAAAIEETSAAMEQIAQTVRQIEQRADNASSQAGAVSVAAEGAGDAMLQANDAMERIKASSIRISDIIGMIDNVAFQTNLLALNASVEAARAGDAGKGFAVVAVEVRRLAQSTATASSDIKALIEQSGREVRVGGDLLKDATDKLGSMLSGTKDSSSLVREIAKATQEQSVSVSAVLASMRQMDEMTQHNAALVEETNAAIEQTEREADQLDAIVDHFVIDQPQPVTVLPTNGLSSQREVRAGNGASSLSRSYRALGNAAVAADWEEF